MNIRKLELGIFLYDFLRAPSAAHELKHKLSRNPGALHAGFPEAYLGIDLNPFESHTASIWEGYPALKATVRAPFALANVAGRLLR